MILLISSRKNVGLVPIILCCQLCIKLKTHTEITQKKPINKHSLVVFYVSPDRTSGSPIACRVMVSILSCSPKRRVVPGLPRLGTWLAILYKACHRLFPWLVHNPSLYFGLGRQRHTTSPGSSGKNPPGSSSRCSAPRSASVSDGLSGGMQRLPVGFLCYRPRSVSKMNCHFSRIGY
jgi:hypothetical protein